MTMYIYNFCVPLYVFGLYLLVPHMYCLWWWPSALSSQNIYYAMHTHTLGVVQFWYRKRRRRTEPHTILLCFVWLRRRLLMLVVEYHPPTTISLPCRHTHRTTRGHGSKFENSMYFPCTRAGKVARCRILATQQKNHHRTIRISAVWWLRFGECERYIWIRTLLTSVGG